MPNLEISLLGPFQVRLAGEVVRHFRTAKVQALLVYLAMAADYPQSRTGLAGLLWPEQPEAAARLNLRQSLYRLRRIIPPAYWRVTRQTIQFDPDSDYDLDVAAFTDLMMTYHHHLHLDLGSCRACLTRLHQAAALYRGDFLVDFSMGDSSAFEEWAMLKREWLRREALQSFYHLAAHYEQQRAYDQSYQFAWRQIELDPLREEAHQQVMRALALSGRRSEALAQYDSCRRLLAETLAIAPSPETTALYKRIRDQGLDGGRWWTDSDWKSSSLT